FFFSGRRRHTRFSRDWSSDVCSSDLGRSLPWTRSKSFFPKRSTTNTFSSLNMTRRSSVARFIVLRRGSEWNALFLSATYCNGTECRSGSCLVGWRRPRHYPSRRAQGARRNGRQGHCDLRHQRRLPVRRTVCLWVPCRRHLQDYYNRLL